MKKRKTKGDNPKEDISRKTLLILVMLAIVVSAIGTWTVMSAIDNTVINPKTANAIYEDSNSKPSGLTVGLTVEENEDNGR